MLTHGAHIDDVTLDGVTPLHVTAHYGYIETAKLLIEKGADINGKAKVRCCLVCKVLTEYLRQYTQE